jgi:hypothetical protein
MTRAGLGVLACASICLLVQGCVSSRSARVTVSIPHPSRVAIIPAATQIAAHHPGVNMRAGLAPGTLVDRAAITRIDERDVCFQISFWALEHGRIDLGRYEFSLAAHDASGSEVGTRREPRVAPVGTWQIERPGRPTWRMPGVIPRVHIGFSAADLCFPNESLITESTRSIRLAYITRGNAPFYYIWELDPSAAYPADADPAVSIRPERALAQPAPRYAMQGNGGGLIALPSNLPQVPGGHPIDTEWVRSLLDARFGDLRRCLDASAERDPRLLSMHGATIAEFTIGPSGIGNVQVVQNDFTPAVARCLSEHLSALSIPPDPMRWTSLFRYGVQTQTRAR